MVGASEIKLYLEVSPNFDFNIDNVSLEEVDNGGGEDWEEEAAERINTLRKRDLRMDVVMPEGTSYGQLMMEVAQLAHSFPFGTAVKSPRIAACWDAGDGTQPVNDAYCKFVEENYNWVVDTYRMKWKPMEKIEGQWDTEVRKGSEQNFPSFLSESVPTRRTCSNTNLTYCNYRTRVRSLGMLVTHSLTN